MGGRHIFVVGLNEANHERLRRLRGAEHWQFHGIIEPAAVYDTEEFDIAAMLAEATAELEAFGEPIAAVVGYMDFPVSTMLPILCERFGTRTTSLESLLKCEHKYWSRRVQREVIPEHIPAFTAFDPFDERALEVIGAAGLYFPFFVKPIKSSGSKLGFRIATPEDFQAAIERLRAEIGLIADPFNTVLEHARLPPEVAEVDGGYCIAEEIIGGWQCTLEGYVFQGEPVVYGVVDSIRYPGVLSFYHYLYPSQLPQAVQDEMIGLAERVMAHIGYDNAAFNVEFFWDEVQGRIWLLEINTRISQSHCDLFEKVDGVSHQQVTVDLALGQRPDMPSRQGDYALAGKFFFRVFFRDALVTRVPHAEEIAALEADYPGAVIDVQVVAGQRLSTLPEQDSYSYALAHVWLGAADYAGLLGDYEALAARLAFEFTEIEG
ncbi:ATP-grasp domain-containing protein [Halomonas sp. H5]|uniref:ATP-grasp domain-containing protein n=1 Tax=Halomonas sp. H5 TaxID=3423910 RepID=UPI003D36B748